MDVICGRKSSGTITGDILINGHKKDDQSFARVMGCGTTTPQGIRAPCTLLRTQVHRQLAHMSPPCHVWRAANGAGGLCALCSYVEQFDLIVPYATVRETLMFSAELRLDASVSPERRKAFVNGVIQLLELDEIADRLVGDESSSSSISAGERKRLTIGVELVANPTVIFADEPTSGLDSRAAASVMRALKRVP